MADHDGGYKLLFSHPRMVEELLRGFVHEPWVAELDFRTLESYSTNLVTPKGRRQRHIDMVWRLRWQESTEPWFYVYLLHEFQSTSDPFMGIRLLAYVGLLLDDLVRKTGLTLDTGLPVVFPIVVYNGIEPWTAPLDLASLFHVVPPGFEPYLPSLHYLVVDESRLTPEELALPGNRVATLFQLEQAQPDDLPRLLTELADSLLQEREPELHRTFVGWILDLIPTLLPGATIPRDLTDFREIAMLEQKFSIWRQQLKEEGREEGRLEGRVEGRVAGREDGRREGEARGLRQGRATGRTEGELRGRRAAILRLLDRRFGKVPRAVRGHVAALATVAELDRFFDRALAAGSLAELRPE